MSEYFVNDAETNIRAFDESLLADAQGKAAFAIERASENEREAAQLRTDAEGMKAENLRLEAIVQPRTISFEDRKKLGSELLPFSQILKGRKVKVSSLMGDAVFGLEIIDTLTRARIDVDVSGMGRAMWVGWVQTGVKITGNGNDAQFIAKLAKGINSSARTDVFAEWNPKYSEILVFVGAKPIPGLPSQQPIPQQKQKNSTPARH